MKKKRGKKDSDLFGYKAMIGSGVVVVLIFAGIFYVGIHAKPASRDSLTVGPVPVYFQSAKDAMPFPTALNPAIFKRPEVHEAYEVAKEIPGTLAQQPCYCYCQREGHRGLLDCFRTEHAATCNICIREALLAGRMHREGKSVEEIRTAIIQGQWERISNSTQPNTQDENNQR